jgi:hypothetical protein
MSLDLVLFGGTGDLAWRKLMPALFQAFRHGTLPENSRIIGVARDDLSDQAYRELIAARFENTTDDSRCFTAASDVSLVTRENSVLCLNYLARVGDCLYAGNTDDVGKAPCRTSASGATPPGLFRVIAVLSDTVSSRNCPAGTLQTLVHLDAREVVCLGMP